jgi:hypothetical protein
MSRMVEIEKIIDKQQAWQQVEQQDEATIRQFARDSLEQCKDALAILCQNLKGIGYDWADINRIQPEELSKNILTIQQTILQPIPPILKMFWEMVGAVSLVDLDNYRHVDFWKEHKIFSECNYCDGLHVDGCNSDWANFICDDFSDWKTYQQHGDDDRFLLSLSPDGFHKDNISGGASYGLYPGDSWNPIWQNYEWPGERLPLAGSKNPPDFLSYIRIVVLECAGFPAFLGVPAIEPVKKRLLEGVQVF